MVHVYSCSFINHFTHLKKDICSLSKFNWPIQKNPINVISDIISRLKKIKKKEKWKFLIAYIRQRLMIYEWLSHRRLQRCIDSSKLRYARRCRVCFIVLTDYYVINAARGVLSPTKRIVTTNKPLRESIDIKCQRAVAFHSYLEPRLLQ